VSRQVAQNPIDYYTVKRFIPSTKSALYKPAEIHFTLQNARIRVLRSCGILSTPNALPISSLFSSMHHAQKGIGPKGPISHPENCISASGFNVYLIPSGRSENRSVMLRGPSLIQGEKEHREDGSSAEGKSVRP